jgi:probable phosphoglycerate mutase
MKNQTIIICRHGETDGNRIKNKILGRSNDSLNSTGVMHAETLAKKIKKLKVERILTSKTLRALQTAKIISEITGIPIKIDVRLNEYNFGKFTGRVLDRKEIYKNIKSKSKQFSYKLPGGESDKDVIERTADFTEDLLKNGVNVVVCTHSFPAFVLKNLLNGYKVNDFINLQFESMKHDEIVVIKK